MQGMNDDIPPVVLSADEEAEVQKKVAYELNAFQHHIIYVGGILNPFVGLFIIAALYHRVPLSYLLSWYAALFIANAFNMYTAYRNRFITPSQPIAWKKARHAYHNNLGIVSLLWGIVCILYVSENIYYQLFLLTFLELCIVGFCFGTITDYKASIVSVSCILLPYLSVRIYSGIYTFIVNGADSRFSLSVSLTLIILAVFSLLSTYYGYELVKKFFRLNFLTVALSEKLENANKFLEQRVKERTIELEDSLKLVKYQATHDLLTDLPNQRLLLEYLQTAVEMSNHNQHQFCVICFTINELEKINDGLGHKLGDFVIKTVAQRFKKLFGKESPDYTSMADYVVALSRKDVFIILLQPLYKLEELEDKVETLFSILDEPVQAKKNQIKLTASIGVSIFPNDGMTPNSLLMNADAAMLRAKQRGGNTINFYKSEINADISRQLEIESNLHNAVEKKEFILHYQPFIDLTDRRICGAEALIRWQNAALGFLSPVEFIHLAEANGIIVQLGEWVLNTACRQTKIWQDLGFPEFKIAVNLSAKQLHQKDIVETIANILKETNIRPETLELELTETAAFNVEIIPILKQLKDMGLSLSIDDFGTGYSGLSNLKLFSIDKLKIDQSFVKDVMTNTDSQIIVSNTIKLAKKLNISVLAEGVETKEQLEFLESNGCDLIQGYYFSKPLDVDNFQKFLLKNEHMSSRT